MATSCLTMTIGFYMCCLFRGAVLGLEVQCLKVLGLRLRDNVVIVPGMVQVMINMTFDLTAVASALADHIFPTW